MQQAKNQNQNALSPFLFLNLETETISANVQQVAQPSPGYSQEYIGYLGIKNTANTVPNNAKTFTFAPSKDFKFSVSKDADCNIDLMLHMNPKNIMKNIPKIIQAANTASLVAKNI